MSDEEIRAIFDQLRRVGVDLGRPPGLALGTGFGPGEVLTWLRGLPDEMGHDAFAEQLTERVTEAAQDRPLPDLPAGATSGRRRPDTRVPRLWPTREPLQAGIDILVRDWDPLGARLGELTREAVEQPAFDILGGMGEARPVGRALSHAARRVRGERRQADGGAPTISPRVRAPCGRDGRPHASEDRGIRP